MTSIARRALILIAVAAMATVVATAAQAASSGGSAKAWCAAVIEINTKYGSMKNKTFLPNAWLKLSVRKAVIEAALANKTHLLAITPSSIKTAQEHELVWFAHMKAAHYGPISSSLPMTAADARSIAAFERTKCGIKGV